MSVIATFLTELNDAKAFEDIRIIGYQEVLSLPPNLLSALARNEVNEGIVWSQTRANLLELTIVAVTNLLNNTYPDRVAQIAPAEVIAELAAILAKLQVAIGEIKVATVSAIDGTTTVSTEHPIV